MLPCHDRELQLELLVVYQSQIISQTQQYKVNDTTYVQYEKVQKSIHWFTFTL